MVWVKDPVLSLLQQASPTTSCCSNYCTCDAGAGLVKPKKKPAKGPKPRPTPTPTPLADSRD